MANPQPSHFAVNHFGKVAIRTGYHPGSPPFPDDPQEFMALIHSTVKSYLSVNERNGFEQTMSQNKLQVVTLFFEAAADYLPRLRSTTYNVFGYSKLHELDHISLLGLYQGLLRLDCRIDDFLAAYEDGRLFSFIQEQFSQIPAESRGGYYKWFLEQEELFNSLKPPSAQELTEVNNMAQSLSASCHVCRKITSTRCGRCKKVWYCTKKHQKADWHRHKKMCGKD
ncbi:hypothetical protein L7F22_005276 [Adiantum nelumboides]|nr:hypothetical protein [Adiantum nelumboides]